MVVEPSVDARLAVPRLDDEWSGRTVRFLGLAVALVACGPTPPPPSPRPAPPPVAEAPRWSRFDELATFAAVSGPFQSSHRVQPRRARLWVSRGDALAYQGLVAGSALGVGAAIVEPLAHDDTAAPELYLVMEKTPEGWLYLELDGRGRRVERRYELCQRCHQEGLSDELFGVGAHGLSATPAPAD